MTPWTPVGPWTASRSIIALATFLLCSVLPASSGAQDNCTAFIDLDYPLASQFSVPGDIVRVRLTVGSGLVNGGTQLSINRIRFDLACNSGFPLGLGCTSDGGIVEYEGDSTITTTCPSTSWFSDRRTGSSLDQIVFTPSNCAVDIPAGTPNFCWLEFDVRVRSALGSDTTPAIVEQVAGIDGASGDARCDNGIAASTAQASSSFPLCPVCDDGNACTQDVCDQNAGSCIFVDVITPTCDDNNPCTVDFCNYATGGCENVPTCAPDDSRRGAGGSIPQLGSPTCNGFLSLQYPLGLPPYEVGETERVKLTIGSGSINSGTELEVNRLRFELDCRNPPTPGLNCADDGDVIEYQGDASITTTCPGTTWSSGHAISAFPNELVLTPDSPIAIPSSTPNYCAIEFDIKILSQSNDGTVSRIDQAAGFQASSLDAQCNNGFGASRVETSALALVPQFQQIIPALRPPGETNVDFGHSVAALGNNVLVGAPLDEAGAGAVYLFDANTDFVNIVRTYRSTAPRDTQRFGTAIAAVGVDVLVGAPGVGLEPGAAYLFNGTTGELIVTLRDPDNRPGFGAAVAAIGSVLVVGAPGDSATAGAVHLFDRSGNRLRTFTSPAPETATHFGTALTVASGMLLVGAPGAGSAGAAYLFNPSTVDPPITLISPTATASFGVAVAAVNTVLAIGDPFGSEVDFFDTASGTFLRRFRRLCEPIGSALAPLEAALLVENGGDGVLIVDPATGDELGRLEHPAPPPGQQSFGSALATAGTRIIVGAPTDNGGRGAAYVFESSTNELVRALQSPRAGPRFGAALAVRDATSVVVGAPNDADGAGAAYAFATETGSLLSTIRNPTPDPGDAFGAALAGGPAQDSPQLVVGAPGEDGKGAAYVFNFSGPLAGAAPDLVLRKPVPSSEDGFGASVGFLGADVLVGAPFDDTAATDSGAVYLFNATTGAMRQMFQSPTGAVGAYFGTSLAVLGTRVIVGAPFDAGGSGRVYVFDTTTGNDPLEIPNPDPGIDPLFGAAVAAVGTDAVLVGAPQANDTGRAYLFDVTTGALRQRFSEPLASPGAQFGFAVGALDGDLLIGAPLSERQSTTIVDTGETYLFSPTGDLIWRFGNPTQASRDQFGFAVLPVESDVLIGAANGATAYLFTSCGDDCASAALLTKRAKTTVADDEPAPDPIALACAGGYCDDRDPCTIDNCDIGGCSYDRIPGCTSGGCKPQSADCSDENACNGAEDCRTCAGCFLHEWTCCGQGTKCVGEVPPPEGESCIGSNECDGMCHARLCECGGGPIECGDCNDLDSCTMDVCNTTNGQCVHQLVTEYALLMCRTDIPNECNGQLPKSINKPRKRAFKLIERSAQSASDKPKKATRLLVKAQKRLTGLAKKVEKMSTKPRPKITLECGEALSRNLRDAADHALSTGSP